MNGNHESGLKPHGIFSGFEIDNQKRDSIKQGSRPNVYEVVQCLNHLNQARAYSIVHNLNVWEFAIEIADFLSHGISRQTLRAMVAMNWIEHKREVFGESPLRQFKEESRFAFNERSCFVITGEGRVRYESVTGNGQTAPVFDDRGLMQDSIDRPTWDRNNRELKLGTQVVKRFKWPATVQFTVLDAFEVLSWPNRISDPLPRKSGVNPKRRLHDVIKCLNKRMDNQLIRFRGDGTGCGITHHLISP